MVACSPSKTAEGLHVGLLFIAPGLTIESATLAGGEERVTVSIPNEYQQLPEPKWVTNVTLEVSP